MCWECYFRLRVGYNNKIYWKIYLFIFTYWTGLITINEQCTKLIKRTNGSLNHGAFNIDNLNEVIFQDIWSFDDNIDINQQARSKIALRALAKLVVQGWIKGVRHHKDIVFIQLTDGSTITPLQVVSPPQLASSIGYGSCVEVSGTLIESPAKGQSVELQAQQLNLIGACDTEEYPLKWKKSHSMEYLRQYLHLRSRNDTMSATMRVRNQATQAIHQHYQKNGYIQVHTPILTSNDCEGAGEIFQVEPANKSIVSSDSDWEGQSDEEGNEHFFNVPSYLTVSAQLHLEVMAGSFPRVYTFSPTFRAENSRSRHHLSEFYMVEAEVTFTESLEDICMCIEDLVKDTTQNVLDHSPEDLQHFMENIAQENHMVNLEKLIEKPFVRLDYSDAIKLLEKNSAEFQYKPSWGCDLQKEHERWLVSYCDNYPVFVINFPKSIKPFYARTNDDDITVASVDLLAPGVGEICGGSLREERYDIIKSRLHESGLHHNYDWYLDLRRFGSAPHGGYGLGFERYIQTLLGIQNIKDTIPFPRSTHSCKL